VYVLTHVPSVSASFGDVFIYILTNVPGSTLVNVCFKVRMLASQHSLLKIVCFWSDQIRIHFQFTHQVRGDYGLNLSI
jgi:hypothetical protein